MLDQDEKADTCTRLRRIEGQVRGVAGMIEEGRYCMDVLTQTRSIVAAMRAVENRILEAHMKTCVADALRSGDQTEVERKMHEVMEAVSATRRSG